MNWVKEHGIEILNELHQENRIDSQQYSDLMDAVQEIELLRDRDEALEELWAKFGDVPMNPETECIEEPFMGWGVGIHREEIWHWFDARHSKGVAYLLGAGEVDQGKVNKLIKLGDMCGDCESSDCAFNSGGVCRFALVHERGPEITEEDGCIDYNYREGKA